MQVKMTQYLTRFNLVHLHLLYFTAKQSFLYLNISFLGFWCRTNVCVNVNNPIVKLILNRSSVVCSILINICDHICTNIFIKLKKKMSVLCKQ